MRQIDLLEDYCNEDLNSFIYKEARKNAKILVKVMQHNEAKPQYKKFLQMGGNLTYEQYIHKLRSKEVKEYMGGRPFKKGEYPIVNKYLASKYHN